jgi:DNA-binding GntR family transcriptional regulator
MTSGRKAFGSVLLCAEHCKGLNRTVNYIRWRKANFSDQSLYKFLKSFDISIFKAKRSIEVIQAATTEATHLNIEKDSPVVLFQSHGYTENGTPFEYMRSRYPAYKARFESEVYQPKTEVDLS